MNHESKESCQRPIQQKDDGKISLDSFEGYNYVVGLPEVISDGKLTMRIVCNDYIAVFKNRSYRYKSNGPLIHSCSRQSPFFPRVSQEALIIRRAFEEAKKRAGIATLHIPMYGFFYIDDPTRLFLRYIHDAKMYHSIPRTRQLAVLERQKEAIIGYLPSQQIEALYNVELCDLKGKCSTCEKDYPTSYEECFFPQRPTCCFLEISKIINERRSKEYDADRGCPSCYTCGICHDTSCCSGRALSICLPGAMGLEHGMGFIDCVPYTLDKIHSDMNG